MSFLQMHISRLLAKLYRSQSSSDSIYLVHLLNYVKKNHEGRHTKKSVLLESPQIFVIHKFHVFLFLYVFHIKCKIFYILSELIFWLIPAQLFQLSGEPGL